MNGSLMEYTGISEGITDRDFRIPLPGHTSEENTMLSGLPERVQEARCPVPGGFLVFEVGVDVSRWVSPTVQSLVDLLSLPPDWDSYGAQPVHLSRVTEAIQLLGLVMRNDTPAPSVVPTTSGSVQLEWHTNGIDLEIEILALQKYRVSFEDSRSRNDWERVITSDLEPIAECIVRLQ